MSYEGYKEHICTNGHYLTQDSAVFSYGTPQTKCDCGADFAFHHSVDLTNGTPYGDDGQPDDPNYYTRGAPIKEIGFTDVWHTDHYGNRYATKLMQYAPDHSCWKSTKELEAKAEQYRKEAEELRAFHNGEGS